MAINYFAIVVCAALSMALGAVWYGPLFGKKWMEIVGASAMDMEQRKKMQKEAAPLYVIQFLLVFMQVYFIARLMPFFIDAPGADNPFVVDTIWFWLAFIIPTVAGSAMWNNDKNNIKWARFLIQGGYQLVLFAMFGFILGMWK